MFGETFQTAGLLSTRPLSVSVSVFDSNPQNRIDRGSCNISFPVVLDVCCAWCLWGREILFPFCLFRVSIRFTPTLNRTITQTERIKGHFVCLCVCVLEGGECVSRHRWWSQHIIMRRAFSVFRGYRRASEDDDEVFVCSPGHKVTWNETQWTENMWLCLSWICLNCDIFSVWGYPCALRLL